MKRNSVKFFLAAMFSVAFFYFCGCSLLNKPSDKQESGTQSTVTPANPDNSASSNEPDETPDQPETPSEPNTPVDPEDPDEPEKPDNPEPVQPDEPITPPEPIKYTVKYFVDGELISSVECEENSNASRLPVSDKKGYLFVGWAENGNTFDFDTPITKDTNLEAVWKTIIFHATFVAEGNTVSKLDFTVITEELQEPEVPEKDHYTGIWQDYLLDCKDITVSAIYTPVNYSITFKADDKEISVVDYNIETIEFTEPAVPAKEHYEGAWEDYALDYTNKVVNAVYTPIKYTAIFKVNDDIVAQIEYTVENKDIEFPEIPAKTGYTAEWSEVILDGNTEISAIYTPVDGTEGIIYEKSEDGTYTVTGFEASDTSPETIIIPAVYNGIPVSRIKEMAFYDKDVKNIKIYASITAIEKQTFYLCTSLESVTFPSTLKSIDAYAFANTKITRLELPEGTESIATRAFASCTSLEEVILPDSLKIIGERAFLNCTSLKKVTTGKSLAEIGTLAFSNCPIEYFELADTDGWTCDGAELSSEILSDPAKAAIAIINASNSNSIIKNK